MLIDTYNLDAKPTRPIRTIIDNLIDEPCFVCTCHLRDPYFGNVDATVSGDLLNLGNSLRLYPFPEICLK